MTQAQIEAALDWALRHLDEISTRQMHEGRDPHQALTCLTALGQAIWG